MRIFVACWFFPPSVSSEGIVTYKLLRNSRHVYDVCSSASRQWSYRQDMPLDAGNVTAIAVETDDLNAWVNECVRIFEERHAARPYDAIMTRSMPPESIEVGRRIHEAHPDLPWIASIADPIAKSPYDIKSWIFDAGDLDEPTKADLLGALRYRIDGWRGNEKPEIARLCQLKDIEDYAIDHASALIFPHEALRSYVLGPRRRRHAHIVHHSFDRTLYPQAAHREGDGRTVLTFTGHSDYVRSLEPLVRALQRTRTIDKTAVDKLDVRFIGHVNEEVRSLVYNFDLYDCVTVAPSMGYLETLEAMQASDWLIHVDACFDFLEDEGGSVYFAGKIADYLGTDAPVLAITGKHSPAYGIISRAGGLCFSPDDVASLAQALIDIANGRLAMKADRAYRDSYDAQNVAGGYDEWMEALVSGGARPLARASWPAAPQAHAAQKFLSICVPAYNASCYLDRCLFSIAACPAADQLEVIVVDDGSSDGTGDIADQYAQRYPGLFKALHKDNGGHGSAINAALDVADGIYFRVVDSDDWIDGTNLAALIANLRALDKLPDLVSSNYHRVNTETGQMTAQVKNSGDLKDYVLYDFETTDLATEYFSMASMMAKTELLRALGFKLQEHTYYVDVEYLLFAIPFIETVMFTPEYIYRYSVGNADQSIDPAVFASRYDHHDRVIRRMARYYAQHAEAMGHGQRSYMKSLFTRHLLDTHYQLGLKWDPDRRRGYARAQDFDAFLRETAPDLHAAYALAHPAIRPLRASGFDPSVPYRPDGRGRSLKAALRRAAGAVEKGPIGKKIAMKATTRRS